MQLAIGFNCPVSTLGLGHQSWPVQPRCLVQEIVDGSDISIPLRRALREAGVTFRKQLRDICERACAKSTSEENTEGFTGYCYRRGLRCMSL